MLKLIDQLMMRFWRFFVSLKCGILLLALIGAVSIYGTMGLAANSSLQDNAIPMARAHVFESRWFIALLLLFAMQLVLSTWHVTKMSFTIWWKRDFKRTPFFYQHGKSPRAEIAVPGGPAEVESFLAGHFTRAHRDGNAFFAHRGIISRFGPTIVHAGIIIVIAAQIAKVVLIWGNKSITEGRFTAAEGEFSAFIFEPIHLDQQITPENSRSLPLNFWIRVLDFDEIKYPNSNVPAFFSSLIEMHDPKTNTITVAQLDMNHSFSVGDLQFHQASYVPTEPGSFPRFNFDVRDRTIDERIAVTDAHPSTRVRVGDTQYLLEVDGTAPGAAWRIYTIESPIEPIATGRLSGPREANFSYKIEEFFPHFQIDPESSRPINASDAPHNPAARVSAYLDEDKIGETWLFYDQELSAMMPTPGKGYKLALEDIQIPRGADAHTVNWADPSVVRYVISVSDRASGEVVAREVMQLGQMSEPRPVKGEFEEAELLGTEGIFEVRAAGPTQRFVTVLSVVSEPTVPYINLGVGLILVGALMTFVVRYRALYGLWNEERGTLQLALVPRWGQSPVREEFDLIVAQLSHGAGEVKSTTPPTDSAPEEGENLDELDAVQPETVEV